MSRTYTNRPPKSARAARRAWDYFAAKYPGRTMKAVSYSPRCDGLPGWVCELQISTRALDHWGSAYSSDWWLKSAPAETIRRWAA